MEVVHVFIMAWMAALTIGGLLLESTVRRTNKLLAERHAAVAIQEALQHLSAKLDRYDLHRERDMREAVERFIAQVEADPVALDRMHVNLNDLKLRLAHR